MPDKASLADASLSKFTNPNPLDLPVSLSVITLAASIISSLSHLLVNFMTMFYTRSLHY